MNLKHVFWGNVSYFGEPETAGDASSRRNRVIKVSTPLLSRVLHHVRVDHALDSLKRFAPDLRHYTDDLQETLSSSHLVTHGHLTKVPVNTYVLLEKDLERILEDRRSSSSFSSSAEKREAVGELRRLMRILKHGREYVGDDCAHAVKQTSAFFMGNDF